MSKNIIINTDYLKSKGGTNIARNGEIKKQNHSHNMSLKPNKIKQALINRIKTYHSELLNKERIQNEINLSKENEIKQIDTPKSEYDESIELFNQMTHDREKRENRKKLQFADNITGRNIPQYTLPSPTYLEEKRIMKKRPMLSVETNQNNIINITSNDTVPYGILKGGLKPTYRQFTQKNQPIKIQQTTNDNIVIPNAETPPDNMSFYNERRRKFEEFKKQFNKTLDNKISIFENNTNTNLQTDIKNKNKNIINNNTRRIHKRIKKHRTLGKYKGKIGILVKGFDVRRQIEHECSILKNTPITTIKEFLLNRGLIKVGSSAPDFILREMYESCFLSGDINNLNGSNLLHNYLNK